MCCVSEMSASRPRPILSRKTTLYLQEEVQAFLLFSPSLVLSPVDCGDSPGSQSRPAPVS